MQLFRYTLILIILFIAKAFCYAQDDSTTFTLDEYFENIISYHPLSKKANLHIEMGKIEWQSAKGKLDPTIEASYGEKQFNDKMYYSRFNSKLNIPTSIGLNFAAGYDNASGEYLNPESTTDPNGLWFVGAELDVLQGFLMNERKAALKQARIFQEVNKNEQRLLLNELIYNASTAYLQWQLYFHFNEVLIENRALAEQYLNNTKDAYLGGEKTTLDTLEAYTVYQEAEIKLQKNKMELIKAKLNVASFLWYMDQPIGLQQSTRPENYQATLFSYTALPNDSLAIAQNPLLLTSINKLSLVEIEQKLKREKLKPKLKLKYNPLLATSENSFAPTYAAENYSWGIAFQMPLFIRSERADFKRSQVKMQEIQFDIDNKRNELLNKIDNAYQQQEILQKQVGILKTYVANYKLLLDGENEKFIYGESSVFLLNKRQEKYINAQLKYIDSNIKSQKERLNYLYYTNQLIEQD